MLKMWRNDSILKWRGAATGSPLPCAARAGLRQAAVPFCLAGMVWAVWPVCAADAATPVWRGAPLHYAVDGAPLPDVLRDVLAVEGLSADIGRDVKGAVHGRFDDTPGNVFAQLTEAYGLVWYFDGRAMHVGTAADMRSRVIPFAPMTREAVASLLRHLDLDDARLPVRYSATTVKVAGPSRFVDAVAEAIDKAQRQTVVEPSFDETVIRVFPLRYAQAQDVNYTVGPQTRVMPGVASLLRRLMTDTWQASASQTLRGHTADRGDRGDLGDAAARAAARAARGGPPPLPSLPGLGLTGSPAGNNGGNNSGNNGGNNGGNSGDGAAPPLPDSGADTAAPAATPARRNIVADQRSNAVVISDLVSMMPNYERVIAMLDQPQELIEIDAVVIDVSSKAARSLGVHWGGANGRVNGASGVMNAPLSFGTPDLVAAAGAAAGLNLATLVGNSAQYLFAQIHALEDSGDAKVLSRPQVLTLNNTEAALTSRSSVYVRVAGNQAVDLFNIDTGLTLKVTPSVESGGDPRRAIRLNIQIEDGSFDTSASVDGIPRVDNHSVVTQAVVRDGESLLIGGYQYERSANTTSKVPVLGDVPYLGALFRDTQTTRERLERLILITPRLKRVAGDGASVAALAVGDSGAPGFAAASPARPPAPMQAGIAQAVDAALRAPTAAVPPRMPPMPAAPPAQSTLPTPSSTALPLARTLPWENRHDR